MRCPHFCEVNWLLHHQSILSHSMFTFAHSGLDVDTGGESGTISLSRFNILVKSQDVNGLHLNGQLVDIRIANQKVQITLEGSVVFEYEDTAQPPNAGAKCLIQNAQVQYSFTR